ncbi:hypothetical protein STCU_10328 [Strigomonas culicis]|uniref:Cyclin N-terminal domain-containing protein n=1 Tax=Strigomonas culicis TaxID=28005 RepID=S9V4T5_9TRYP|nr:hypothetical protein STCU_10328 [Strigomonas culicis]|eukprot:EPY17900.1 hypothetical protein STCU_10328 [Strigomonas culicis]
MPTRAAAAAGRAPAAPATRVCDGMDDIPHMKALDTHGQWQLKAISNLFELPPAADGAAAGGAPPQDSAARLQHVDAFLNLPGADGDAGTTAAAPFNPFHTYRGGASAAAVRRTFGGRLSDTEMGWDAWNVLCADRLNRSIIINSMDEVVHYVHCDRKAFYFAAMYLDLFVRETRADPLRFCQDVRAALSHRYAPQPGAETTPAIARAIFMQVVLVCAMLACKVHQTYPPTIEKIILCLHEEDRFANPADFTRLELRVSHLLGFNFLREEENALSMLELLLDACGGAQAAAARREAMYTQQMRELGGRSAYLADEVQQRLQLYREHDGRPPAAGGGGGGAPIGRDEEYELFCCIANLLCDLAVRGLVGDSATRRRGAGAPPPEARMLRIPATVLVTSILFVTAELTHAVLPPPLAALYEAHAGGSNSGVWQLPAAVDGPAAPALEHYVRLLQVRHLPPSATAPSEDCLAVAYEEVKRCFQACKSGTNPCDGIVRERYKKMLAL